MSRSWRSPIAQQEDARLREVRVKDGASIEGLDHLLWQLRCRAIQIEKYQELTVENDDLVGDKGMLWHFTRYEVLCEMIERVVGSEAVTLRLTDASQLNDPLEGTALFHFIRRAIQDGSAAGIKVNEAVLELPSTMQSLDDGTKYDWAEVGKAFSWLNDWQENQGKRDAESDVSVEGRIFTASFTLRGDDLALWIGYGQMGRGVAIGTPVDAIRSQLGRADKKLYRVCYEDSEKRLAVKLLSEPIVAIYRLLQTTNSVTDAKKMEVCREIMKTIQFLSYMYKHSQFSHEKEVRVLHRAVSAEEVRATNTLDRFTVQTNFEFVKGKGHELLLGPQLQNKERKKAALIHALTRKWGAERPSVAYSGVQYRSPAQEL